MTGKWVKWAENNDDYHSPKNDSICFVKLRNGEVIGPDKVSSHFDECGGVGGWFHTGDEFDIVSYVIVKD